MYHLQSISKCVKNCRVSCKDIGHCKALKRMRIGRLKGEHKGQALEQIAVLPAWLCQDNGSRIKNKERQDSSEELSWQCLLHSQDEIIPL